MNGEELRRLVREYPVVPAVKDGEGLDQCLKTRCRMVFILYGSIMNIASIVKKVKDSGRCALVHVDLIDGMASREISVDYIRQCTEADGIITTKQALVRHARKLNLLTVQRFFLIDSMALSTLLKQLETAVPDVIEVLPAGMPKIIRRICAASPLPVIAGGLIQDREDVLSALNAGAAAVSCTDPAIWEI